MLAAPIHCWHSSDELNFYYMLNERRTKPCTRPGYSCTRDLCLRKKNASNADTFRVKKMMVQTTKNGRKESAV